jgi:Ca2+-binding EF-hand superfamily protein
MIFGRIGLSGAIALGLLSAVPATAQPKDPATALAALDTDHDGTLDWNEVSAAATAKFKAADPDHDGTLDAKEAGKLGVTKRQLHKADPDKDGTLDATEFLALVKQRFAAADRDHDGTVSAAELNSSQGRALLRLIQ